MYHLQRNEMYRLGDNAQKSYVVHRRLTTICRLSDKMATFVHGSFSFVAETKITKRLDLPIGDSA